MRAKPYVFLFSLLFVAWAQTGAGHPVCGGEGPTPLPNKGSFSTRKIPTVGTVTDFQVWPRRDRILYRNASSEVYSAPLSGSGSSHFVTNAPQALVHVSEPQERYLLTSLGGWFFDTAWSPHWIQYEQNIPSMEPLFWDHNDLYTAASTYDLAGKQRLRVFRYHAGDDFVFPLCSDLNFEPGQGYTLAQGHAFPYVYLFQTSAGVAGNVISLHRLDVRGCELDQVPNFRLVVEGKVEAVYRFEEQGAVAVKLDHPSHNLLWQTDDSKCQFFDVGKSAPVIPNPRVPVLASHVPGTPGITLYDFRAPGSRVYATTVLASGSEQVSDIGDGDLYLDASGNSLLVKPDQKSGGENSFFYHIGFQGFLSEPVDPNESESK